MKQVQELSDCTAFVVLNKKGEHRATVHLRYGPNHGAVQCDVYNTEQLVHQKKAGGGGYDKAAAALAGAVIDGYKMADHCGHVEEAGEAQRKALMVAYIRGTKGHTGEDLNNVSSHFKKRADKIGAYFANWGVDGWGSLFFRPGLGRLRALGYTVIRGL